MNQPIGVMIAGLTCIAGLALAQEVTYNFDQSADFSKYKTYRWVEIKGAVYPDQMVDKQIKTAIDTQMSQKGLRRIEDESADLYLGYQVGVDKEKSVTAYNMGGSPWGYGGRWGGGISTATTSTVRIGQLVVDIYDPAMKQMVWRGMGAKEINPTAKPEQRTKNLNKGVEKLLKNFPPKSK